MTGTVSKEYILRSINNDIHIDRICCFDIKGNLIDWQRVKRNNRFTQHVIDGSSHPGISVD